LAVSFSVVTVRDATTALTTNSSAGDSELLVNEMSQVASNGAIPPKMGPEMLKRMPKPVYRTREGWGSSPWGRVAR
jgi:hypothetical protein